MWKQGGGARVGLLGAVLVWLVSVSGCAVLHHGHDGHGTAQLSLNNGQRWTTDAPLRQGMSKIRDALETELASIRASKASAPEYDRLAKAINDDLAYMIKNCKLDKQTDAMLHLVIADILAGTDAMQGKNKELARRDGAFKIAAALDNYARYFDHPGWRPLPPE